MKAKAGDVYCVYNGKRRGLYEFLSCEMNEFNYCL